MLALVTLVNRPLFLHPRLIWRVGRHPVVFTAEPGPGSDQLEKDATTLFNALEPQGRRPGSDQQVPTQDAVS